MIISMKNLERLSIAEMEEFLRGSRKLELAAECQEAVYQFLEGLLASQQYRKLKKRERGIVRRFGAKITGLSRAQVTRLIGRRKKHRHIEKRPAQRPRFARRYTAEDVALMAETTADEVPAEPESEGEDGDEPAAKDEKTAKAAKAKPAKKAKK